MARCCWSLRTILGTRVLLALLTLCIAGVPPAATAQEAPAEREVLDAERLEVYQPSGRFSRSEVQWMLWYLLGICIFGFLIFAALRIAYREHHPMSSSDTTSADKSRGRPTRSTEASPPPGGSSQPSSEHRYKL